MSSDRHADVERFDAALSRGRFDEARRIWPRVKALLDDAAGDWVTLADLAHDERVDRRTMLRRTRGQPFLWRVRPGLWLVDRQRYLATKTAADRDRKAAER
jgi:hypothetical protein